MLIYVTVTDEKMRKKIKVWEESQLSKDNVIIAVQIFDCYMVEKGVLEKSPEIAKKFGRIRPPGFYIFQKGELIGKADGTPRNSAIFSCLKKVVAKVYKANLPKLVSQVTKLRHESEKLDSRKVLLMNKLARMKEGSKDRPAVNAEMEAVTKQMDALKAQEREILDLEKKKVAGL